MTTFSFPARDQSAKIAAFLFIVMSVFLTTSAIAQTSKKKTLTPTDQVRQLIDRNKVIKARELLDATLLNEPAGAPLLYQRARLELIEGGTEPDDNILGWRYPSESKTRALGTLNKVLALDPNYGEAHSLAGIVHTLSNDFPAAKASFTLARQGIVKPPWLPRNRAVLAALEQDYVFAAQLLRPIIERRPGKNTVNMYQVYSAAWQLMSEVAMRDPKLDPVPAIRDGLVKRIRPEDFEDFQLGVLLSKKPTIVLFGSSDTGCRPCRDAMDGLEILARNHSDEFDFAYVSFDPWYRLRNLPTGPLKEDLRGLPAWKVFWRNAPTPKPTLYGANRIESLVAYARCLPSQPIEQCNALRTERSAHAKAQNQAFSEGRNPSTKFKKATDELAKVLKKPASRKTQREINQYLKQWPGNTQIRLTQIAVDLGMGLKASDNPEGITLDTEAKAKAVTELTKLLERHPNWATVSAILAGLHALSGERSQATAMIKAAEKSYRSLAWLRVARGIIAFQDNNYSRAMDHLKPLIMQRPSHKDGVQITAYEVAWSIARRIGATDATLDPANIVRLGLARRVVANDLPATLKAMADNAKPTFVLAASMDNACSFCLRNQLITEHFARLHADKFDFLYVSAEPYYRIGRTVKVINRSPQAAPWQAIAYKGQVQHVRSGMLNEKKVAQVLAAIPSILDGSAAVAQKADDRENAIVYIEKNLKSYFKRKGAKAAAVSIENGQLVWGTVSKAYSWKSAATVAMERCKRKLKRSVTVNAPCELYIVAGQRVLDKSPEEVDTIIKNIKRPRSFDIYLRRYKRQRGQKALALTVSENRHLYRTFYVSGRRSLEQAKRKALKQCNDSLKKFKKRPPPCQIYFENDEPVLPLPPHK